MTVDPIHQFKINNLVPLFAIHGHEIAFTNSALFMLIIVLPVQASGIFILMITDKHGQRLFR